MLRNMKTCWKFDNSLATIDKNTWWCRDWQFGGIWSLFYDPVASNSPRSSSNWGWFSGRCCGPIPGTQIYGSNFSKINPVPNINLTPFFVMSCVPNCSQSAGAWTHWCCTVDVKQTQTPRVPWLWLTRRVESRTILLFSIEI